MQTNEVRRCCYLLPPRFEHQIAALSAERPVYWISAETRADPAEPRLRLATCLRARRYPVHRQHRFRRPVQPELLGDLPAARGVRRFLRLHRPARKVPRFVIHRVHQQHPALLVTEERGRHHPLARQRRHVLHSARRVKLKTGRRDQVERRRPPAGAGPKLYQLVDRKSVV